MDVGERNSLEVFAVVQIAGVVQVTVDILYEQNSCVNFLQKLKISKITVCISSSSFFLFLLRIVGKDLAEFMFLEPSTFALRLAAILKEEMIEFLKYKTPIEMQALIEPKCV